MGRRRDRRGVGDDNGLSFLKDGELGEESFAGVLHKVVPNSER